MAASAIFVIYYYVPFRHFVRLLYPLQPEDFSALGSRHIHQRVAIHSTRGSVILWFALAGEPEPPPAWDRVDDCKPLVVHRFISFLDCYVL